MRETSLLDIIILMLATWRISSMFVNEDGPLHIFHKIRHKAGMKYDEFSVEIPTTPLSDLLACVWCFSVWVGFFITVVYLIEKDIAVFLALPFALSAVAILLEKRIGGD